MQCICATACGSYRNEVLIQAVTTAIKYEVKVCITLYPKYVVKMRARRCWEIFVRRFYKHKVNPMRVTSVQFYQVTVNNLVYSCRIEWFGIELKV